jgi:hypothetical protein
MPINSTRGAASAKAFGLTAGIGATEFITATGGTVTTSGNFKIHTFTGPGTFSLSKAVSPSANGVVDYLVIAGGGSGANFGGGGGAGGYRESHSDPVSGPYVASPLATPTGIPVTFGNYPITVGAGGTAPLTPGGNSIFSTITSAGGGTSVVGPATPGDGGSGGGRDRDAPTGALSNGNVPPVSPPQGNPGGASGGVPWSGAGGGGGAGGSGNNGSGNGNPPGESGGPGGPGVTTSIDASPVTRGGGGGGAVYKVGAATTGGPGGGGAGGTSAVGATAGTANTGGGGGSDMIADGANGGSGIVIIRYKFQ